MSGYGLSEAVAQFSALWEELDHLTTLLLGRSALTPGIERHRPGSPDPEFDFLKWCCWTYLHYHEFGRVTVRFLERRSDTYAVGVGPARHRDSVNRLRTFLVHSLDSGLESDRATLQECATWFSTTCGTSLPRADEHWTLCTNRIALEAPAYLQALIGIADAIESDNEFKSLAISDWVSQLDRDHKGGEFDALVVEVARDLGYEHLNAVAFRQKHESAWRARLASEHPGYRLQTVLRPYVEKALLEDILSVLPITGLDVMETFGVPRGPEVGSLLQHAKKIWSPGMSRADLLGSLKATRVS